MPYKTPLTSLFLNLVCLLIPFSSAEATEDIQAAAYSPRLVTKVSRPRFKESLESSEPKDYRSLSLNKLYKRVLNHDLNARQALVHNIASEMLSQDQLKNIKISRLFNLAELQDFSDLEITSYLKLASAQQIIPPKNLFILAEIRVGEKNNSGAAYNLGWLYQAWGDVHGKCQFESNRIAIKWYTKAANRDFAMAQNSLGCMYAQGLGEQTQAENDLIAFKWFTKAAIQGFAVAQLNLARMFAQGRGVPKNSQVENDLNAVKWFSKAANQGHAVAQLTLGLMYALSRGVPKNNPVENYLIAIKWYNRAANQNFAIAQYCLGWTYEVGLRVPNHTQAESDLIAVKWYTKAANQGYAAAQHNLGRMHTQGRGVPENSQVENDLTAVKWYAKAASQGYIRSKDALQMYFTATPTFSQCPTFSRLFQDKIDALQQNLQEMHLDYTTLATAALVSPIFTKNIFSGHNTLYTHSSQVVNLVKTYLEVISHLTSPNFMLSCISLSNSNKHLVPLETFFPDKAVSYMSLSEFPLHFLWESKLRQKIADTNRVIIMLQSLFESFERNCLTGGIPTMLECALIVDPENKAFYNNLSTQLLSGKTPEQQQEYLTGALNLLEEKNKDDGKWYVLAKNINANLVHLIQVTSAYRNYLFMTSVWH